MSTYLADVYWNDGDGNRTGSSGMKRCHNRDEIVAAVQRALDSRKPRFENVWVEYRNVQELEFGLGRHVYARTQ